MKRTPVPANDRPSQAVTTLNHLLADECVLATQTRSCHWNVTGPHFHDLHQLFGAQYDEMDAIQDAVAERARALGGRAVGTLGEFLKLTRMDEPAAPTANATQMTARLLGDHETLIRQLRQDVAVCTAAPNDPGTTDFLTGVLEQHEKMAWMLRSVLDRKA